MGRFARGSGGRRCQLGLGGLPVEVDRDRFAVEGAPGLDVGAVDGDRTAHERTVGDGRSGESVGEPLGVDARAPRLQDLTELHEEPLDPWVGLGGVPVGDPESAALVVAQGVEGAGHLHEVGLVVPLEGVELAGDQEAQQAQTAWTSDARRS